MMDTEKFSKGKLKVAVQLRTGLLTGTMSAAYAYTVHQGWRVALLADDNDLVDFWMSTEGKDVFYSVPAKDIEIFAVERGDSDG